MDALILAAGYATRLYPLTLTKAKPLLPVCGIPMIEHVLNSLKTLGNVDRFFVVTNDKFHKDFEDWSATRPDVKITIINDGSTAPENALGAIGDINFTRKQAGIENDMVIMGGDNLLTGSLEGFRILIEEKKEAATVLFDVGNLNEVKKYNAISVDNTGKITSFEEKPQNPVSSTTGICLYYYPKHILPMIDAYVSEGNNPDQPGRFLQWLHKRQPVYTWQLKGQWLDIGSKETLEEANRIFASK